MSLEPDGITDLRLASIVASADDAIISKDLSGTIASWNRAAERIFGYTQAEAIGQSIRLIVPPERYQKEEDVLLRVRAGESVNHYETSVSGLAEGEPIGVYASNEMMMPAFLPGTAPIATPDQIILVLGDFRGDIWLMELDPHSNKLAGNSG